MSASSTMNPASSSSRPRPYRRPPSVPLQTRLPLQFVIVGGGISGLACAIGLRRVGHNVLVLESEADISHAADFSGGMRMPPNMTKIFHHWGLSDRIDNISLVTDAVLMSKLGDGDILGSHRWVAELLKEAGGEFAAVPHATLRETLYEIATELGATVRTSSEVLSVNPDERRVTFVRGGEREYCLADVIIGADGAHGICRVQVQGLHDIGTPMGLMMFSSVIPGAAMRADEELRQFLDNEVSSQYVWFGDSHCALCFRINAAGDCAFYFYAPDDGARDVWDDIVPTEYFVRHTVGAEPRLQKLARLSTPRRIKVVERETLEDWVDDSGRMVVVGDAAHPFPPGVIQTWAMALEDASVLAKLFSHLRTRDQIPSFLYAFQDLRQARVEKIRGLDVSNIQFMTMPPSDMTRGRDAAMRAKYDEGKNVLGGDDSDDDDGNVAQWDDNREIFGYDAEDEADNWWVEWGLLAERAREGKVEMEVELNIQATEDIALTSSQQHVDERAPY